MRYQPAVLYRTPVPELKLQLRKAFHRGLQEKVAASSLIFFRADDIGVPSKQFSKMITLFLRHKTPLCLAAVPSWLTRTRLEVLQTLTGKSNQFCWHQHGWLHKNHEQSGKKQEFGPSRSWKQLQLDLSRGKTHLSTLLGEEFSPFFTPPWNRCSQSCLKILQELHFTGVSRSRGASPPAPAHFPDLQVNVDLHTRKETSGTESLQHLLEEISLSLATGTTGVMLHHQRMNTNAFHFLEIFLGVLQEYKEIQTVHFKDMV